MQSHSATLPRFILLILAAILVCTVYIIVQFSRCSDCIFAEDFGLFYNAGQLAVSGSLTALYNAELVQGWLQSSVSVFHPFLYPPHSLLLLFILGLAAPACAFIFWYSVQIGLVVVSIRSSYIQALLHNIPSFTFASLVIFSPFIVISLLAGQVGLLWAVLFAGVMAHRKSSPVLAGLMLALFSFKPQLGFLLPLLLLAEKNWKSLFFAGLATGAMILLSILIWGLGPWHDYQQIMALSWQVVMRAPDKYMTVSASPYMGMRMLGLNSDIALLFQEILSITIVIIIWRLLKKPLEERNIMLLLVSATFLVSPYSYIYDSVILALPCIALLAHVSENSATSLERITLVLLAFLPIVAIKTQPMHIPYSVIAVFTAFLAAVASAKQPEKR